ncbi:MAG: hypothetical protein NC132_06740 [Corallococcus sp.]|nr:hypothetical protein [Corallococcus sp.]
MYDNGNFEQMVELLKSSADKKIRVIIKLKKGIPKDFRIDLNSLAEIYNDERFKYLSLSVWGFNDKSYKELSSL